MDHELSRFAKAIKERPRYLETKADIDELRKKLLVSQLRDMDTVYPFVGDDLKTIEFRAPGTLKAYRASPQYLQEVCQEAQFDRSNQSVLDDFADVVKPPKGQELFAYLAHMAKNTDICAHLFNTVEDVEERKRLTKDLQTYASNHPEQLKQLGDLMHSLKWPQRDDVVDMDLDGCRQVAQELQHVQKVSQDVNGRRQLVLECSDPIPSDEVEQAWRESPNMKQFKLQNGIGGLFSTRKTAVQRVLNQHDVQHPATLGKRQDAVQDDEFLPELYQVCAFLPTDSIHAMVATPELQEFYLACLERPTNGRQLVQQYLERSAKTRRQYEYPKQLPSAVQSGLVDWAQM